MALDPRILLTPTTPDLMTAIQQGISAGQAIRQAPMLEALRRQQLSQAEQQQSIQQERFNQEKQLLPLRQQLLQAQINRANAEANKKPEDKNLFHASRS